MVRRIARSRSNDLTRGSLLIEAVVAAAIALIVLTGVIGTFSYLLRASASNKQNVQAAFLEEEGLEAARILRDGGWTANIASHTSGTPFYLVFATSTWAATSTDTFVDGVFERKVTLADVYRDSNKNIVANGGTLDPAIKLVTVSVSWLSRGATTTHTLSTYLANVFNN